LVTPGCTRAVRASGFTARMRRIRASDSSTPSPRGSAPPERPVPAPRAVTGTFSWLQARSTSRTSSSVEGSATTIGSCR